MIDVLIPVGILFAISVLCAILLTLANKYFAVKEDETAIAIRDCLPGANCGACGYSGCDGYAKALADKDCAETNLCIPGGDATAKGIAEILGVEAIDVVEQVAYVACNGVCDTVQKKFEHRGYKTCRTAKLSYCGDKYCIYACLGCGDCAAVCPREAIYIVDNVARVEPSKCIGCGICVRECPKSIIRLINDTAKVVVECSSHDKGAQVRKYCTNGCIACMKCQKVCPHGAVTVIDNLATIDYSLCTGCGACVEACPVHCIHEDNFLCGAHSDLGSNKV